MTSIKQKTIADILDLSSAMFLEGRYSASAQSLADGRVVEICKKGV